MDVLPSRRYDPNELVVCPYDEVHRVRISRLPYHLLKCAKQHPSEGLFEICPYNARHVIPRADLLAHFSQCPDKPMLEDFREVRRGKIALPNNADWKAPDPNESWDNELDNAFAGEEEPLEGYDEDMDSHNNGLDGQTPVDMTGHLSSSRSRGYVCPAAVPASSRPPMFNPHGPSALHNGLQPPPGGLQTRAATSSSSVSAAGASAADARAASTVQPTGLGELSAGKNAGLSLLGKTALDIAAREGAQERPLDIAAWCSQQANIAKSHISGDDDEAQCSEEVARRPGIAPKDVESGGYLRVSRGRGALLKQHLPLRRPGTGTSTSSTSSEHYSGQTHLDDARSSHLSNSYPTSRAADGTRAAHEPSRCGGQSSYGHRSGSSSAEVYEHYTARADTSPPPAMGPCPTRQSTAGLAAMSLNTSPSSGQDAFDYDLRGNPPRSAAANHSDSRHHSQYAHPSQQSNATSLVPGSRTGNTSPALALRLMGQRSHSAANSETRVHNIDKLLKVISDLRIKQSQGVRLTSDQVALLERKAALEEERDSVVW
ncbi:uncharacterized protein LOC135822510 [Sycon ciliatum]|uniref:uncharacterized protein LOC135822510 n=1 Tax=Sycon ciliatum TaxID=27933 RepID=UPI0031F66B2C